MKVIKHLRSETPDQRLKHFFKFMPLCTKIIVPIIFLWAIDQRPYILSVSTSFAFCLLLPLAFTSATRCII